MSLRSRIRSWCTPALVWLAALVAATCTEPSATRRTVRDGVRLQLTASVAGTAARTLVVDVTAADIPSPGLLFNLPVDTATRTASGTLTIPPGTARTISVSAYDSTGTLTHQGQATVDIKSGTNPTVTITLFPLNGSQPIDVRIGSIFVAVTPANDTLRVGQTGALAVAITDSAGNPLSNVDSTAIRWASFDTRLATVDTKGNVTGVDSGDVQIVASYAGAAGAARVSVVPSPVILAAGDIVNDSTKSFNGTDSVYWAVTAHFDTLTASMIDTMPGTVLPLGDNVYEVGSLAEYTTYYDPSWGRFKSRSHPVPGNHEYISDPAKATRASGYYDYWGPQAGVRDSGYYSFDVGAWHLIALNSEIDTTASSPQVAWLAHDLATTKAKCVLAYWHRPLFSSGVHGDNPGLQAFWDTLYKYGADVVLNGHDHDFERFAPQDPVGNADPANGIREFVVGTGGAHERGAKVIKPNSELFFAGDSLSGTKYNAHGIIRISLGETGYSWKFITTTGLVRDSGSASCH